MKSQNTTEKKEPKRKGYKKNVYIAINPKASPFNADYWRDTRISYMVNNNNWIWNNLYV